MWSRIFKGKQNKSNRKKSERIDYGTGSSKSKLSKVVHSLTLKRYSKENDVAEIHSIESSKGAEGTPSGNEFTSLSIISEYSGIPEVSDEPVNLELEPCGFCGRTFIPTTLAKHINICQKMATKKRKQFDSFRQRREGTDLAVFLPKNYGLPTPKNDEQKQSPKSNQNISLGSHRQIDNNQKQLTAVEIKKPAISNAVSLPSTGLQSTIFKEKVKPKSITKRSLLPQNEKCPHCERHFGTKAYERHVEWCKEKTRLSNNQNNTNLSAAKERLQARTKYRAPNLKTKRGLNREKYSGVNCEEVMNNEFSDGIFDHAPQTPGPNRDEVKITMSTSLSSSIISDGKFSQKEFVGNKNDDRCSKVVAPIILKNRKLSHITSESKEMINPTNRLLTKTSSTIRANQSFVLNEIEQFIDADQYSRDKMDNWRHNSVKRTTENDSKNDCENYDNLYEVWKAPRKLEFELNTPESNVSKTKDFVNMNCNSSKHEYTEEKEVLGFKVNIENPEEPINCFSSKKNSHGGINSEMNGKIIEFSDFAENGKNSDYLYFIMAHEEIPKLSEYKSKIHGEEQKFNKHKFLLPMTFSKDEQSDNTQIPLLKNRGFSDKYDPFLSAKRQLEELCSPTSTIPSIAPTVPKTKQRTSSLSSSISSTSNPRNSLTAVKSNFRRTSSLRGPRKPSNRPLFIPPTLQKPTIQRGLSDEGPISSKFLKPEEYDEMPVKSVCINDFANIHSPKVIKRDSNSSINRRNLRLNLSKPGSKVACGVPLSKTDSLAIFLKHENEAKQKVNATDLTEKDLKDKSNTLSKQSSQKSLAITIPSNNKENIPSLKDSITNMLESQNSFNQNQSIDFNSKPTFYNKNYAIRLEPIPKPPSPKSSSNHSSKNSSSNINLSTILDFKDNDYIDPKLINVCDNLSLGVSKLSDSDLTYSSNESACPTQVANDPDPQTQQTNLFHQTPSNRHSTEKRNLKRQIRLGKNQFLYDMSPDSDPYSEECDKTISVIESNNKFLSPSLNEPPFDDFDIEEFLSSFDHDDDQFPIFKDCKEFLLNRSFNKHCNIIEDPSSQTPSTLKRDYQDKDENREIFITIETSQNESSPSPGDPSSYPEEDETDKNGNPKMENSEAPEGNEKQDIFEDFGDTNRNNARNISKLYCQNDSESPFSLDAGNMMYAADSDEISSNECYPVRQGSRGKLNSDSAYGSLSRYSADQRPVRRNSSKTRIQSATSTLEQPLRYKSLQKIETKPRNRNPSASSSGSETPVLPILPQEDGRQEKESQFRKDMRMSKFCYECGSKFLISQAKFCMECGVKRIALD